MAFKGKKKQQYNYAYRKAQKIAKKQAVSINHAGIQIFISAKGVKISWR